MWIPVSLARNLLDRIRAFDVDVRCTPVDSAPELVSGFCSICEWPLVRAPARVSLDRQNDRAELALAHPARSRGSPRKIGCMHGSGPAHAATAQSGRGAMGYITESVP
jgi:hypothetical protein